MNNKKTAGNQPTLWGKVGQNIIVFAICILFPGAVTAMVPATWITFHRSQETVSCTARTCVYFIVPYQTQHVNNVTEILEHEEAATTRRQRKNGRDTNKIVHVDGKGYLQIRGADDQMAEVSVSPASLANVVKKAKSFLQSATEKTTTIFAIANWKFGAIMGGVLTSFTLLFVIGYTAAFFQFVFTWMKKMLP